MQTVRRLVFLFLVTLLAVTNITALAQDRVIFNGGISLEERMTAPTTGTKLVFFVRAGNFLSDVQVVVKDQSGQELVNTVSKGPWLILDLPAGRYRVSASIDSGETQSVEIAVENRPQEFGFMFTSVE